MTSDFEWTPARINLVRWAHWRAEKAVRRTPLTEITRDIQREGVDVSYSQIHNAYRKPRVFRRLCEGKPGFLRAIYRLYGKPKGLG